MANNKIAYDVKTIKAALVYAHDTAHNKKALSKDDFSNLGMTEQAFDQWVAYVTDLRSAAVKFVKLTEDVNATSKAIQEAKKAVWDEWESTVKAGVAEDFSANFFIRKEDAEKIGHWASFTTVDTAVGRMATNNGLTEFRRRIEILIGIRMAGNKMLDDEERDLITTYEKAVRDKERAENTLNGYKPEGRDYVPGLNDQLNAKETVLKKQQKKLEDYNLSDEDKKELLKPLTDAIGELNKAIKATKKTIDDTTKIIEKNVDDYGDAIALLKTIGDRS